MSEGQFNFSAYMRDVCERAKKEKYILKRDELFPGEGCGIDECDECARHGCEVGIRLSIKDIKKLVVQCIHNRIAWQFGCLMESELAFSEYVRHPLTKCKYGYYYGEHPKLTDAQIAARMRARAESKKAAEEKRGCEDEHDEPDEAPRAKAAAKHVTGEKTTVPDLKKRPDYTGPDGGEKRIRDMDLIRDLLIAEARPGGADMPFIAGVLVNRFQSPGMNFGWGSQKPKIIGDVIKAPGQFSGFGLYDSKDTVDKVKARISQIKHDSKCAESLQTAEKLATQIVEEWYLKGVRQKMLDKDKKEQYPYFFRTQILPQKGETEQARKEREDRQSPKSKHEIEALPIDPEIMKKRKEEEEKAPPRENIFYYIKKRKD